MKLHDFQLIREKIERNEELSADAVTFIQNELHDLLNSFLNGGFSGKGFILYPLIKDVSAENRKRLSNIIFLLSHIDSKRFSHLKLNKNISRAKLAEALCHIYKNFEFGGKAVSSKNKKPVKDFLLEDYRREDWDYLKPIESIKEAAESHIKEYALGFYIHGSFATNDYIKGWSDVDTMLVLKESAFDDSKNLLRISDVLYSLRKEYLHIDALQHHGTMVITEYDLDFYPETFLPVDALSCSKSLLGHDKSIRFRIRNSQQDAFSKLSWINSYFNGLDEKKLKNPYEMKFAVSLITLFPSLYLQAKGKSVYKKYSFAIAEKDFSDSEWKAVKHAKSIRGNWKLDGAVPFLKLMSKINPVPAYLLNSRYLGMAKAINESIDKKLIINGMRGLMQKAMQKLKAEK